SLALTGMKTRKGVGMVVFGALPAGHDLAPRVGRENPTPKRYQFRRRKDRVSSQNLDKAVVSSKGNRGRWRTPLEFGACLVESLRSWLGCGGSRSMSSGRYGMPIEFRIDHKRRMVFAKGHGTLTDREVFGYQLNVWSRPEVVGYNELVDLTDVQHIELLSGR